MESYVDHVVMDPSESVINWLHVIFSLSNLTETWYFPHVCFGVKSVAGTSVRTHSIDRKGFFWYISWRDFYLINPIYLLPQGGWLATFAIYIWALYNIDKKYEWNIRIIKVKLHCPRRTGMQYSPKKNCFQKLY